MKKIKIPLLLSLSLMSCFAMSETNTYYMVMPVENNFGPVCESDVSSLEDGMYLVCGADSEEIPVVNGEAFEVALSIPSEAFSCANGYADHFQALKLAVMLGENVYTPKSSYMPTIVTTNIRSYAKGAASYVDPSGNYNYRFMYSGYIFNNTHNIYYDTVNPGTYYTLIPKNTYVDYRIGTFKTDIETKVTAALDNRACVITP